MENPFFICITILLQQSCIQSCSSENIKINEHFDLFHCAKAFGILLTAYCTEDEKNEANSQASFCEKQSKPMRFMMFKNTSSNMKINT